MHSTVRRRFSKLEKPSNVFNIVSRSPRISSTKREMFSSALDISSQMGTVAAFEVRERGFRSMDITALPMATRASARSPSSMGTRITSLL